MFDNLTMEEVVEHLYNKEYKGNIYIDDTLKVAIDKYYETLNVRYDEIMDYSSNYINILQYDSFAMNKEEIQNNTKRLIVK